MSTPADTQPDPLAQGYTLDRQRALTRLVRALVAERAALEAEAAGARDEAVERAELDFRLSTADASEERDRQTARIDKEMADALAKVEATYDKARRGASERYETKQAEQRRRHARKLKKAKAELQDAVWLAETVYESGAPKHKRAHEERVRALDARLDKGAAQEMRATQLSGIVRAPDAPERDERYDPSADPVAEFERVDAELSGEVARLANSPLARAYRGRVHLYLAPLAGSGAGVGVGFATEWAGWQIPAGAGAGAVVLALGVLLPLAGRAKRLLADSGQRVLLLATHLRQAHAAAVAASAQTRDRALDELRAQRAREVEDAKRKGQSRIDQTERANADLTATQDEEHAGRLADIEGVRERDGAEVRRRVDEHREHAERAYARATSGAAELRDGAIAAATRAYTETRARLERSWFDGMARAAAAADQMHARAAEYFPPWSDERWRDWSPPTASAGGAKLGTLTLDLADLDGGVPDDPALREGVQLRFEMPAMLELPERASLLIQAGPDRRHEAIALTELAMLRLLTALPPGKARFTIIDPVGLGQSFAGFMRLSDVDESIVGARIWTEQRHIEQRLGDLTEHMENVIQKYLRDDYPTIDAYNDDAGELAEPYRFLVVSDFPTNFSETAAKRLMSIAESGARCGVYLIVVTDPDAKLPADADLDQLRQHALVLSATEAGLRIDDDALAELPLAIDPAPDQPRAAELLNRVAHAAVDSGRVEVPHTALLPEAAWAATCDEELRIPLGKTGATRLQELRLGRGTSQHVLIAGKTGSGKSTLLHVLIATAMIHYPPDQLEFYLVDFKKGVEFKAYGRDRLPHVRAVAIESDREFGLSVLQKLDAELKRRGDLFRSLGVQSLAQYRRASERDPALGPMPRTLLIIDEFQEIFVEDDAVAQEAALLLDRLVRQGRAFGIHVLLGSQTLSGAYTLARSTVGQMAVRIALQCSETDSYLILSDDNGAARLLSRPGEAIYNDANGMIEGNSPFQCAWLDDHERDAELDRIAGLADARGIASEPPIVFEGSAHADVARNPELADAVEQRRRPATPVAWIGEPVAIKAPTGVSLHRRAGANLLVVGQQTETAAGMLATAMLSLAAQTDHAGSGPNAEAAHAARFVVLDGSPPEDPLHRRLASIAGLLPHAASCPEYRAIDEALGELDAELARREESNQTDAPPVFLVLHALHRLRSLRRKDDDFSFSMDDDKPASPDRLLKHILVEGPDFGVFTLCWCDTASNLQRALDREAIGAFGSRALLQMSGADSSLLIDSVGATNLGLRRGLFVDDERSTEEKFRPYALPDDDLVRRLAARLAGRSA